VNVLQVPQPDGFLSAWDIKGVAADVIGKLPLSGIELSTLIEKINEALGTDFTAADQLFLDQLKEDALDNEQLRRSAQVNSEDNFAHEFDDALTRLFIDRMDQNQELFAKYMDDEEFQNLITKLLRREVYEESQAPEA